MCKVKEYLLELVCDLGHIETVSLLLDRGVNVGSTAAQEGFELACHRGHDKILSLLLDRGLSIDDETITDINVKTLNYVKKCKKMKNAKNIMLTNKYLKQMAIPFDKGVGICLMSKDTYDRKMKALTDLPQLFTNIHH